MIRELGEALQAALPLITAAANNKRVAAEFRTNCRRLRAQALFALDNASMFWIPSPRKERRSSDER